MRGRSHRLTMSHRPETRLETSRREATMDLRKMAVMTMALGLVGRLLVAVPAAAQSSGNACIKQRIGGNPPCTANDVRIGRMEVVGAPSTCVPGSSVLATI